MAALVKDETHATVQHPLLTRKGLSYYFLIVFLGAGLRLFT
jgi:hypothetical protein